LINYVREENQTCSPSYGDFDLTFLNILCQVNSFFSSKFWWVFGRGYGGYGWKMKFSIDVAEDWEESAADQLWLTSGVESLLLKSLRFVLNVWRASRNMLQLLHQRMEFANYFKTNLLCIRYIYIYIFMSYYRMLWYL
jgi:hypothetical protein